MRRGYRLIAPVVPLEPVAAPAPPLESTHSATENQAVKPAAKLPQRQSLRGLAGHRLEIAIITVLAVGLAFFVVDRFWSSKSSRPTQVAAPLAQRLPSASPTTWAAFTPPPHSIAVLPLVNISGDKDQEYFSDGLTEEILNSLARINELQVAARTSSFYFKGEHVDLSTIAHKLNVASVLEGSVRRAGNTVRISVQLNDAVTGFHLWSQTYDRELREVLKMQTEIADAVTSALKVKLLGDAVAKIDVGGTRNPAAFDAYLRASQAYRLYHDAKDLKTAIAAYSDAIHLDPNYALAFVGRSRAFDELASWWTEGPAAAANEPFGKARADAERAMELTPDLGDAHLVLANSLAVQLAFMRASEEYERALALAPGKALVLQDYGGFAVVMGRTEQGLAASRRAVLLDPLNRQAHLALMIALVNARRPEEAISVLHNALALDPAYFAYQWVPYYLLGNYESARIMCQSNPQFPDTHQCLAMIYDKLGRHADAEAELVKLKATNPSLDDSVQYVVLYAQWGQTAKALSFLEAALRSRHVALVYLKTFPLFDPLRKEPRFQAIERELKFPY
jgi:TolB-like protein/Flp pilus assembly protein TadD